ncbi:hypothetical protein [uncultured Fibrobacter sp.]|uniref:rhamnogalacturonan endolyase family protein n=1 Tax=uncultured Fibrobacter sp. TaxID=261512 RepID=UPI00338E9FC1
MSVFGCKFHSLAICTLLGTGVFVSTAQASPQMEKLGRGLSVAKAGEGMFVCWRLLGTDSPQGRRSRFFGMAQRLRKSTAPHLLAMRTRRGTQQVNTLFRMKPASFLRPQSSSGIITKINMDKRPTRTFL